MGHLRVGAGWRASICASAPAALVATGCAYRTPIAAPAASVLRGELVWEAGGPLPASASAIVQIRDVARQDVAAPVLGEVLVNPASGSPLAFSVRIEKTLGLNARPAASARILDGDFLLFVTDTYTPVALDDDNAFVSLRLISVEPPMRELKPSPQMVE